MVELSGIYYFGIILLFVINAFVVTPFFSIVLGPIGFDCNLSKNQITSMMFCISILIIMLKSAFEKKEKKFSERVMNNSGLQLLINFIFVLPISACLIKAESCLKMTNYTSVLEWLNSCVNEKLFYSQGEKDFFMSLGVTVGWYILLTFFLLYCKLKKVEYKNNESKEAYPVLLKNYELERLLLDEVLNNNKLGKLIVRDYHLGIDGIKTIKIPLAINSIKDIDNELQLGDIIMNLQEDRRHKFYDKIFDYGVANNKDIIEVNFYINEEYEDNEKAFYFIVCYK